jgi:hypothetical protein
MSLTTAACRIARNRPADLPSFAVLDLCDDFVNILNQLLLRARSHGIVTPPEKNFSEMIEKLRIGVDDPYPDNVRSMI